MKAEVAIIGGTGFGLGGIVDDAATPY